MKKIKLRSCLRLTIILFFGLLILNGINACKESGWTDEIAEKRVLINTLIINEGDNIPLLLGRDTALTAVFSPEQVNNSSLIWSSADESIAKVDQNGVVTTVGLGTTTVTVQSKDGSFRKAAAKIEVIDKVIYATSIAINPSTLDTYPNVKTTLTATIAPANVTYKQLIWSSSNESIAVVDQNGVVTGVAPGTVTITVKPADQSSARGTITVNVIEIVPIETITINTVLNDGMAIDERLVVDYDVAPALASKQLVAWSSDNEAVATVSHEGVITGKGVGQAIITVTSTDGNNVKATLTVDVKEGKINDIFTVTSSVWKTPTANASAVISNGKFLVTMYGVNPVSSATSSTKFRGDFQRNGGVKVHAGEYSIVAFKFNRPIGTAGNVVFDTNLGSYLNGNNKLTTITGNDGVQVHYADLATGSFGSGVKLSTSSVTTLTTFQLKVADFTFSDTQRGILGFDQYSVYWVKTFKSVAELEAYINQ